MANVVLMSYGGVDIIPVPIISIQRTSHQAGNRDNPLGYTFSMTLTGTLTPYPSSDGLIVMDQLMEDLRETFNSDGKQLLIQCGPVGGPYTEVMSVYPRIVGDLTFGESSNNWVSTIPYTIQLSFDTDDYNEHPTGEAPPFIESFSEDWSVEFPQDRRHFVWDLSQVSDQIAGYSYPTVDSNNPFESRITHTVNVKGKQSWSGTGVQGTSINAVDNAFDWAFSVFNGFGYDATNYGHAISGWTNLNNDGSVFDHYRTHSVNEADGTIVLTESFFVIGANTGIPSGGRKITEDFTVEVRKGIDIGLTSVSINGSLQGLEERSYANNQMTTNTIVSAYQNASSGWAYIQDRMFPRAQLIFQSESSRRLHFNPLTKSIGHNPSKGIITYAYEFNDRPCSFISGSLSEVFTITDNYPSDVFAKLPVLGRAAGPVLQAISTITESVREVTIEVIMPPPTGCSALTDLDLYKPTTRVEALLCDFQTQLTGAYDQVFKNSDTSGWNPLSGRYNRTVSWTYQTCTGAPTTTLCD